MPENDEPPSPSQSRRSQLPALAPRGANRDNRDRSSGSTSGSSRPPRLSHRSRQGCWTCRARKVKCDEIHPKCGPCTRLNRECDWDHRWNFSNATTSTQVKHANVNTTGNAVWDPQVRPEANASQLPIHRDDLPDFQILTNDEERERKAESQRPGTYGVVVTPDSFSDLPEYAGSSPTDSRRPSVQSTHSRGLTIQTQDFRRNTLTRTATDPNVVVLDRFEEASPTSALPYLVSPAARTSSVSEGLQYLSIDSAPLGDPSYGDAAPAPAMPNNDDHLISHFRRYVVNRLVQPQVEVHAGDVLVPGSTRDVFEATSTRFQPLYHAICALSALNLAYRGGSTIEEALQHYHQAISTLGTTSSNNDDLSSSGVFLGHYILLIFDICFTVPDDTATWTLHLNNLQHSASLRHQQYGSEPHGYLLWHICELDMYACLLGHGNCDFLRAILHGSMLPPLEQQIPLVVPPAPYFAHETATFPAILALNQYIVIQTANVAQAAQAFRLEAAESDMRAPGMIARWQASVAQLQNELMGYWTQRYPPFLDADTSRAAAQLAGRVRQIFEQALLLYHAAMLYTRTSMFPSQRRIPIASQSALQADTELRIRAILSIAAIRPTANSQHHLSQRHIIFPLFMAGIATLQPDVKGQVLDLLKGYEGAGIWQNTARTRDLLTMVYEEQRGRVESGGRAEDVEWLDVARGRSLAVVNCGL